MEKRSPARLLHLQLRDFLAARIAGAGLDAQAAFSDEGKLARHLGVSLVTLHKALNLLAAEQLIVRQPGGPTLVSRNPQEVPSEQEVGLVRRGLATDVERERLALRFGAEVCRVRRVQHSRGEVDSVDDIALPAALFPDLADADEVDGHIVSLARDRGLLLGKSSERIFFAQAPPDVAALLAIEPGTRILMLERVTILQDGRPVEWRRAYRRIAASYSLDCFEDML